MNKQPNEKLIGLFMISGIAIFAIILGIYLKGKFFNRNEALVVMYFEESIKGLSVGSSVVFKGVEIGKVVKIDIIANPNNLDFLIPVYAKMEHGQNINLSTEQEDKRQILDALIDKGLRARLTTQSYLTGQLIIELEMLPDTPIVLKNRGREKDILEIPTTLSPMGEISRGIQNIPLKQSVEKFNDFMDELNRELPVILPQVKDTVANMNKLVKDNSQASSDTIDNLNKALINVSEAAKALRNFADYVERHPESLLKGKRGQ